MKLSAPGKTFLVGEYLALAGGPSFILCTSPRFELDTETNGARAAFAAESPAGRFLARAGRADKIASWSFSDPYEGRGGLGASSAQFLLAYAALRGVPAALDPKGLLEEYRNCAWNGAGYPPSGADLVAQAHGRLTEFDGNTLSVRSWDWPFVDLAFTLFRTGAKLATHEHLRGGAMSIPEESLLRMVDNARTAFVTKNSAALAEAVQAYGDRLDEAGFLSPATKAILTRLQDADGLGLQAAKGCGAMGADIVLLLHRPECRDRVRAFCAASGWTVCGTEGDLSPGLRLEERAGNGTKG